MLPTSHRAPRNARPVVAELPGDFSCEQQLQDEAPAATLLADAFSEFIAAAARLEVSYGELQEQVAELGVELAERNAALNASLSENEQMRMAVEQIVDSMPCGVLVLEQDGALTRINPEGLRLLGLEAPWHARATSLRSISEQAGLDLTSLVSDPRLGELEQQFSLAGDSGKRWIEVRNRRLYGSAGAGQTILILRDVTAQKQAEQERERARRATALAEIAAMLAHEIRNPLASLELFAGLLAGSERLAEGAAAEREWIRHMHAGIRSLSGTVNNVLSFYGVGFAALAPLELASAIESSVDFVGPIAEQAGVALSFAAEARGAQVLANAGALQQLVLNLVSNAVRHTPKGGSVRVALQGGLASSGSLAGAEDGLPTGLAAAGRAEQLSGRRVALTVSDTGSGIRPEHLGEIFRAGFSGSGNTSGLGLAVCQQIVRQHEGEIRVTSQENAGTTFFVELPTL